MKSLTYPSEYLEFVRLFNAEKFFEAHEVLEVLWRRERGPVRDYYHGLIQIAAVFVHIQKGTPEGGKQLLSTAAGYFKSYSSVFMGIDPERLLEETRGSLFAGNPIPKIDLA